ncbi:unnamed protein product [Ectocarpus sp. CCAP 1310/34]|nr:unnamed protein product [Ectocarpus sp. CCAP 1310/34]
MQAPAKNAARVCIRPLRVKRGEVNCATGVAPVPFRVVVRAESVGGIKAAPQCHNQTCGERQQEMASCDVPVHLGSAALSRCRRDDDDRGPAGSFSSSNTAGSPAKLAVRGRYDERSVSESPPGFGIERDDDDDEVAVARRFPREQDDVSSSAKTSGNITRLTDHANGNFRSHTGDMAGDSGNDSQAVSAIALLLLAASPPSRSRRPAASGPAGDGAAAGAMHHGTGNSTSRCTATVQAALAVPSASVSNTSSVQEGWRVSSHPAPGMISTYTSNSYLGVVSRGGDGSGERWAGVDSRWAGGGGGRGEGGGGGERGYPVLKLDEDDSKCGRTSGGWATPSRARAPLTSSSLAPFSANGPLPSAPAVSRRGERWARSVPYSGDEFGSVVMPEGTAGQQYSSKHSHEFPGDGGDDGSYRSRYAASSLASSQAGGGEGGGGGGHQYGDDRGEGRREASTHTRGGVLRIQSARKRDEATMTAPVPMRMRSPLRSPSPPRAAGRKKPDGYRANTWEKVGRGQCTSPIGPSRGSGWSKRWVPDSPGAGCKAGGTPASNGKRGRGRDTGSASCYDERIVAGRGDHAEFSPGGAGSHQRQHPSRVREHGRSPWPLKIPGIAADQQVDAATEQESQKREEVEPAFATGAAAGGGQWRNERGAAKEAAVELGSGEPRTLKRRRAVGARKVSKNGNSKVQQRCDRCPPWPVDGVGSDVLSFCPHMIPSVAGSRRPLAMDLNMEGSVEAFVAAPARNRGVATAASGRPSPRKKSKNLVWSQFRKACDRCTDKKVRCDGSNPTGGFKACTPCKRAGEACLFGICRRSGPRDAHGHKTAAAGVIMKRNDFEKVTERLGQCRTKTCRFVNKDGSFWREHFHCRVGDCSFAGKTLCHCVRRSGFRGADFRSTAGDDFSGCYSTAVV